MNPLARRQFALGTASLAIAGGLTGCFGTFGAARALWKWNDGVSDSKWVKWLLFLGLILLPVYDLFVLGDLIIFNTIEFYSGKNPIASASRDLGNGRALALTRDAHDPNMVRVELKEHDAVRGVYFVRKETDGFALFDAERRMIAHVTDDRDLVRLFGSSGQPLLSVDAGRLHAMTDALKSGASPMALAAGEAQATNASVALSAFSQRSL